MAQLRKITPLIAMLLGLTGAVYAADQYCPLHPYAFCNNTFEKAQSGAIKWHCSCGDDVWVAEPQASSAPASSPADEFKKSQEATHAALAPLAQALAQNRARHQQEKNDLVKVVYCRQNPSASLTLDNGKTVGCETVINYMVAYCTTKPKDAICKDLRKITAHDTVPSQAQAPAPVAPTNAAANPITSTTPSPLPSDTKVAESSPDFEHAPLEQFLKDAAYCRRNPHNFLQFPGKEDLVSCWTLNRDIEEQARLCKTGPQSKTERCENVLRNFAKIEATSAK